MKRLLRGVIDWGGISPEGLAANYQKLRASKVEWQYPTDRRIYKFVGDFFAEQMEVPSARVVVDFFEKTEDLETRERLKEIKEASPYEGGNFTHVLKDILTEQNRRSFQAVLKEAQEIAQKGLVIGEGKEKQRLEGVKDAILHFQKKASDLVLDAGATQTRGNLRKEAQEAWQDYLRVQTNPQGALGKFCGIRAIDDVCRGAKVGELWLHAAYTGELKCLPRDAWVYDHLTNRRRTIGEIYDSRDETVLTALVHEGTEWRLTKAPASRVMSNGVRAVFDLTLSSGRSVGASGNHKFFTLKGWAPLERLKPGDWVAVPKRSIRSPVTRFADDEVKLVGYLLGDGRCGKDKHLGFSVSNPVIRSDFVSLLQRLGYREGLCSDNKGSPTYRFEDSAQTQICISTYDGVSEYHRHLTVSPLRLCLDGLGLWGLVSSNKVVPDAFYGLPDHQVRLLLGALWSTDGSCHTGDYSRVDRISPSRRNDITYASTSQALCQGVQALLLQLGIPSTVRKTVTTYKGEPYQFWTSRVVTAEGKRRFCENIEVVGKQDRFVKLASRLSHVDDRRVPTPLVPAHTKVAVGAGFRHAVNVRSRRTLSRALAMRFAECPEASALRHHLGGDLEWEQVEKVEYRGDEETFDLEVPEHHTFVVNDIVSHNTVTALNWCYQLVTRYSTNVFFVSLEMPLKQLRNIVCVMHSTHKKWAELGYSRLNYLKVRNGELTREEAEFYKIVLDDFHTHPKYGQFEVWCPDHEVTIQNIKMEAELHARQVGLGFVTIDHGGIVQPSQNYRDFTHGINTVIRDAKRLALHFNQGAGIPVLLLFQINRQGKDDADKNDGRYKLRALSHANEAERSADVVTTSYLNEQLRNEGRALYCNLKNRDNPLFEPLLIGIDFSTRRLADAIPLGEGMISAAEKDKETEEMLAKM